MNRFEDIDIYGKNNPKGMSSTHFFNGARRMDAKTAQKAEIEKQNYTVFPRYWYIDAFFVCRDCSEEFLFSANEQRFWYEDRRFYVDSKPKHCLKCRKAERIRLELKKRYDTAISEALGPCPLELKQEIIGVIDALEATEDKIPERMIRNRTLLHAQLANAAK